MLIAGFPQKWADDEFLANGNYTEVKYTRVRQKGYRLSNSIPWTASEPTAFVALSQGYEANAVWYNPVRSSLLLMPSAQTDANGVSKESNNSAKREIVSSVAAKGVKTKTNGKGSERRKRWRAEEIDPMIAAEDAELKVR